MATSRAKALSSTIKSPLSALIAGGATMVGGAILSELPELGILAKIYDDAKYIHSKHMAKNAQQQKQAAAAAKTKSPKVSSGNIRNVINNSNINIRPIVAAITTMNSNMLRSQTQMTHLLSRNLMATTKIVANTSSLSGLLVTLARNNVLTAGIMTKAIKSMNKDLNAGLKDVNRNLIKILKSGEKGNDISKITRDTVKKSHTILDKILKENKEQTKIWKNFMKTQTRNAKGSRRGKGSTGGSGGYDYDLGDYMQSRDVTVRKTDVGFVRRKPKFNFYEQNKVGANADKTPKLEHFKVIDLLDYISTELAEIKKDTSASSKFNKISADATTRNNHFLQESERLNMFERQKAGSKLAGNKGVGLLGGPNNDNKKAKSTFGSWFSDLFSHFDLSDFIVDLIGGKYLLSMAKKFLNPGKLFGMGKFAAKRGSKLYKISRIIRTVGLRGALTGGGLAGGVTGLLGGGVLAGGFAVLSEFFLIGQIISDVVESLFGGAQKTYKKIQRGQIHGIMDGLKSFVLETWHTYEEIANEHIQNSAKWLSSKKWFHDFTVSLFSFISDLKKIFTGDFTPITDPLKAIGADMESNYKKKQEVNSYKTDQQAIKSALQRQKAKSSMDAAAIQIGQSVIDGYKYATGNSKPASQNIIAPVTNNSANTTVINKSGGSRNPNAASIVGTFVSQ